jgi:hypothetical protein
MPLHPGVEKSFQKRKLPKGYISVFNLREQKSQYKN